MPHIPEQAKKLIREYEGLRLEAYKCPAGVWTIGYGHTGGVYKGQKITIEKAEEYLTQDCINAFNCIARNCMKPLNDNQLSALISFVFNFGCEKFKNSTLLARVNKGVFDDVTFELMKWVKALNPKTRKLEPLPGLVRRRKAESDLWQTKP